MTDAIQKLIDLGPELERVKDDNWPTVRSASVKTILSAITALRADAGYVEALDLISRSGACAGVVLAELASKALSTAPASKGPVGDLPAYCNHRHRDHKLDAMLRLKQRYADMLDWHGRHYYMDVTIPIEEFRTIVLGLEALEAPLL